MKNNFILTNFKCLIGKAIINILLKKKRTVILTTDNPFLLKHAKVGQKIEMDFNSNLCIQHVVLLEEGRIKNQGSYDDIIDEFPQIVKQKERFRLNQDFLHILIFILLVLEKHLHLNLPIQDGDF